MHSEMENELKHIVLCVCMCVYWETNYRKNIGFGGR